MPPAKAVAAKAAKRVDRQTRRWQSLDAAHHIHPFTQSSALAREGARVITRAKGIYLWDSEGVRLIDGMSGLWCVQIGYGNREVAKAGYDALKQLPYYNHFFKTTNPWTVELASQLTSLLPDGHTRLLFADSGSEANDTALKLIRYYWNLKGRPEKKIHHFAEPVLPRRHNGGCLSFGHHADASTMGFAVSGICESACPLLVRCQSCGLWGHRS